MEKAKDYIPTVKDALIRKLIGTSTVRDWTTQYSYVPDPPTEAKSGNYDDPTLIYEKKQRFAEQKLSRMDERAARDFKKVRNQCGWRIRALPTLIRDRHPFFVNNQKREITSKGFPSNKGH